MQGLFKRWAIEGVCCPICNGLFVWQDGIKQGAPYSPKAHIQCPHCNSWLQNQPHLQHWGPYVAMAVAFVAIISLLVYLVLQSVWLGIALGIPIVALYLDAMFRYMKIERGHVVLYPSSLQ